MRVPYRLKQFWWRFFPPKSSFSKSIRIHLKDLESLEIGGPSPYFTQRGFLPLYDSLRSCDNAICSPTNIHASYPQNGSDYLSSIPGKNYLIDASQALPNQYQCILSSHVIEHLSNPLKSIQLWKSNLMEPGYLLIIAPYKQNTFDHKRPDTNFNHLLEDYNLDISESDRTHFDEIRQFHDFSKHNFDPSPADYYCMLNDNEHYRIAHHHVFSLDLLEQCIDWADLKIILSTTIDPISNLILAKLKD